MTQKGVGTLIFFAAPPTASRGCCPAGTRTRSAAGKGVLEGGGIWQSSAGWVFGTVAVRDTVQGWHLDVRWDEG